MRIHQQLSSNYVLYYIWIRRSEHFMLILAIKSTVSKTRKDSAGTQAVQSKPLLTLGPPALFLDIQMNPP
jgi:hypothetical protein